MAMFSIDPSIKASVVESNELYRLTHLEMGFQGNVSEIRSSIDATINSNSSYSNVAYDVRPSSSYQLHHGTNWYFTSVIGINTTAPPEVNRIETETLYSELRNDTAFILESFANELEIDIGDSITLYTLQVRKRLKLLV
ncbi:MAG: hypothetical protein ACTSR1_14855 [Candidatus Heimdallarchaeota archaeon]